MWLHCCHMLVYCLFSFSCCLSTLCTRYTCKSELGVHVWPKLKLHDVKTIAGWTQTFWQLGFYHLYGFKVPRMCQTLSLGVLFGSLCTIPDDWMLQVRERCNTPASVYHHVIRIIPTSNPLHAFVEFMPTKTQQHPKSCDFKWLFSVYLHRQDKHCFLYSFTHEQSFKLQYSWFFSFFFSSNVRVDCVRNTATAALPFQPAVCNWFWQFVVWQLAF